MDDFSKQLKDFDYQDILSPDEYCEKYKINYSTFKRRVNSVKSPLILNEYSTDFVKLLKTRRYDKALAIALRSKNPEEKVKLVSIKLNANTVFEAGRPVS